MPSYVYECPRCHKQIEMVRSVKEHETKPYCVEAGCDGQNEMRTVIQPSAVKFLGSGWTPKYGV